MIHELFQEDRHAVGLLGFLNIICMEGLIKIRDTLWIPGDICRESGGWSKSHAAKLIDNSCLTEIHLLCVSSYVSVVLFST